MSMLTPPGMGGKYRITGDKYPRMRRPRHRRRIVVTVVGTVAALGLAGWGTLQLVDVFTGGGGEASAAGRPACVHHSSPSPVARKPLPRPGDITVNVYNATTRAGLAKQTADELKKRGFTIGKVANAPARYDKKVKGSGILVGAAGSADGAFKVLGTQLAGATTQTDKRTGHDVDLIVGDGFKALEQKQAADRTLTALSHPSPAPSASRGC